MFVIECEYSHDSVLYHHLSMPQPEIIGKPTPSFCLSCYFLGNNDPEVGPKQPQLYISQVRFCSRELPPVFKPAMIPPHSYTNLYANILKFI
jgi:hypothetical protein